MDMEKEIVMAKAEDWMFLTQEEIEELVDGEYYWIAYEFPKDDDETWEIGKYNEQFKQFNLCSKITITVQYVIEVQKVEPAH